MITSVINETGGTQATATDARKKDAAMGKDQFLTLLLAQLKNQDPLSPMENTEFTAQMAQFSSLEQLFNVNDNLVGLQTLAASQNGTQALNLIGKEIEASGDSIHVAQDGIASPISFDMPGDANHVTISIFDQNDNLVNVIEAGSLNAGSQNIEWNGRNGNGAPVESGLYSYAVNAVDGSGDVLTVDTYTRGIVEAISMKNGVTLLHVGGQRLMMSDIKQVMLPSGNSAASATVN
jgi:flagellar basal-body rod modification protein FlgD